MDACSPCLSAMFDSTSAVQHRMGASRLTLASPVDSPTYSGPNSRQRCIHFSFTSALIGHVDGALAAASAENSSADATSDLPDPVGVLRMTFRPSRSARMASSWDGYSVSPAPAT
ncbi:MAG: hypothetical protein R2712_13720 [Vicinamibacterales bacterium]